MLDEHGFGDHGPHAARAGESGDGRQQMQKKDGQMRTARSWQDRDTGKECSRIVEIRHAHERAEAT